MAARSRADRMVDNLARAVARTEIAIRRLKEKINSQRQIKIAKEKSSGEGSSLISSRP